MAKYLNPYTDFGFKKLFGEEENKHLLIDFLNQLLPERHQITDLTFQNDEKMLDGRKGFLVMEANALNGENLLLEIYTPAAMGGKKSKTDFFKDRSLYYLTYPIMADAKRRAWYYQLNAIYSIAILDFLYEDGKDAEFHRLVTLKDQDNDDFYDKLGLIYLQMPAFKKTENELTSKFDKWAYFLKNVEKWDNIPEVLNEAVFAQAFNAAEVANFSEIQREDYGKSLLSYEND